MRTKRVTRKSKSVYQTKALSKDTAKQLTEFQPVSSKIQTTKFIKPLNPRQREYVRLIKEKTVVLCEGSPGTAKTLLALHTSICLLNDESSPIEKIFYIRANVGISEETSIGMLPGPQPLTSRVLTSKGWKLHKDLTKEDLIISVDGQPSKLLEIYSKGIKDVYEITTSTGSKARCCLDHIWSVQLGVNHTDDFTLVNTKEILDNYKNKRYHLPRPKPLNFNNEKELNIPPYTLGALLGDGSFSCTHVRLTSKDKDIVERIKNEVTPLGCSVEQSKNRELLFTIKCNNFGNKQNGIIATKENQTIEFESRAEAQDYFSVSKSVIGNTLFRKTKMKGYTLEKVIKNKKLHPIRSELSNLNLEGLNCYYKFIPKVYKESSIENRLSLLQGLMDTDGTIKENGEANFSTSSFLLAKDVKELVESLGGRSNIRKRDRGNTTVILGLKCNRKVSYDVSVSLPENLNPFYIERKSKRHSCKKIIRDYIVDVQKVSTKETQCILIDNPTHLYITDDFVVTHNTLQEKIIPLAYPVLDSLINFMSEGNAKYLIENSKIEVLPISMVRGRSFANSIVIVDECANCSPNTILTLLTRVGENSKMLLLGNSKQKDTVATIKDGLKDAIQRLQDLPQVGIVIFKDEDIVRNSVIKDILAKYQT